jgi:hypothetical protein
VGGCHAAAPEGTTENIKEAVMVEHPQALQGGAYQGALWGARVNEIAAYEGDCQGIL